MTHRIQADHIRGAKCSGTGAPEFCAGQVINDVVGQLEILGFPDRGEHPVNADPVGNEVWRVFRMNDPFAHRADEKGFEFDQNIRIGTGRRNQLDQMHITRRVEKMHAAETLFQVGIKPLGQRGDRQTGSV